MIHILNEAELNIIIVNFKTDMQINASLTEYALQLPIKSQVREIVMTYYDTAEKQLHRVDGCNNDS